MNEVEYALDDLFDAEMAYEKVQEVNLSKDESTESNND